MIIVSCPTKFWAFALAEQLHRHQQLSAFYTTYAYQKNLLFRKLAQRIDKEEIPAHLIHTHIPFAFLMKKIPREFIWNDWYDKWVANQLKKRKDYKIFIGWSGMSLHTIRQAKKAGKKTIVERGSSHILYQNKILHQEYKKFGIDFHINQQVIEKELKEYEEADYIAVPSLFVKNSFLEYGFNEKKLFHNPYGTSFSLKHQATNFKPNNTNNKFKILYLGSINIRKGLIYLFEALQDLNISRDLYEVWFIGQVTDEMKETIEKYQFDNWKFFGHVNHYELPQYLSVCDVGIQPSNEEGLSMVMAQMLSCGVPVIATTNTGGQDIINNDINGFIIPIRSPQHIKEKIEYLYNNPPILAAMKAATQVQKDLSWNAYGNRYSDFLNRLSL